MATRSTIALEYADGTVDQIYAHWDGYIEHNGKILFEHYSNPFKLREMMDLGDLSSLAPEIGTVHAFGSIEGNMSSEEYQNLYGQMTTFYGRDRGEKDIVARRFANFDDYKKNHQYEEYEYILRPDSNMNAVWWVSSYGSEYVLLSDEISKIDGE